MVWGLSSIAGKTLPPPLSSNAGIVVRHVVRWAIYACSLVQAKRVCLKFEAPIVLSVFQIYDAIWLRGVPIPEGSIDPQCVEKHHWIDGVERTYRRPKPSDE
jgi:hypothetical protein